MLQNEATTNTMLLRPPVQFKCTKFVSYGVGQTQNTATVHSDSAMAQTDAELSSGAPFLKVVIPTAKLGTVEFNIITNVLDTNYDVAAKYDITPSWLIAVEIVAEFPVLKYKSEACTTPGCSGQKYTKLGFHQQLLQVGAQWVRKSLPN